VPIHSAIVLRGTSPWNPQTVQSSLQQSLRGALTASTLGIEFRPETASGQTIYALTGPKPLFFATAGNLCLLADNRDVLLAMLASHPAAAATQPATQVAGFDHTSQRGPYARLTALIDGTNQGRSNPESHGEPAFFSVDLRSMSDSFAALAGEQFVERRDGETLRQTVTYQWRNP